MAWRASQRAKIGCGASLLALACVLTACAPAQANVVVMPMVARSAAATPSVSYPAAITALGLQPVYTLDTAGAGTTGPLTNTPASHAQACTGCTLDVDGISFYITGSNTLTDWDFTGFQVFEDGNIAVECDNCRLKARADRGFALGGAQASGGNPSWKCVHCYVDSTTFDVPQGEGSIKWGGAGDEEWDYTYWTESSRDQIQHGSSGDLKISWNYFGGVCIGTPGVGQGGAHCENIHPLNGRVFIDHTKFDFTHMAGRLTADLTAFIFPQAFAGPVELNVDTSVFAGANVPSTIPNCHTLDVAYVPSDPSRWCGDFTGGLTYTFQAATGVGSTPVGNVIVRLTNSAFGRGSTGYVGPTNLAPYSVTTTASGNYDLDSGANLGSTLP